MEIAVIGTGYVGLVTGACLADIGHAVVCVDVDADKVARINEADPPIHERGLQELLDRVVGTNLRATTDLAAAVRGAELTMIAVGTPTIDDRIELEFVRTAARQIGEALIGTDRYHVVVVKSTVVPGTTDGPVREELEAASGLRVGERLGLGMNPEFLREGEAVADFRFPDRIVLGGTDERTLDVMARLYAPFEGVDVVRTTPRTAEMIKYTANSLLASLISFSNEIANMCSELGDVDVTEVMEGVLLDKRFTPILEDGTRIWPGSTTYLAAGCGFGGSCFPKDVRALVAHGEDLGAPMRILKAVVETNVEQPHRLIDLLKRRLPVLRGRRVAVLGLAFKPGTDDVRETPAMPVIDDLIAAGAEVVVHDPIAETEELPEGVTLTRDLVGALSDVAAAILVTSWPEYLEVPALVAPGTIVVDGRRQLSPDDVGDYEGIGR